MLISASRYEDIPAFRKSIIEDFIITKTIEYTNYKNEISLIKLSDVTGFIFWTKNIYPFIDTLIKIKDLGIPFYIHHTYTNYNETLETYVNKIEALKGIEICAKLGFELIWRYDPIIITDNLTYDNHITNFELLCKIFNDKTTKCYFSFLTIYTKLNKIFSEKNINIINNIEQNKKLIEQFEAIAKYYNINLYACANEYIFNTVEKGHCIDPEFAKKVGENTKIVPTRKLCGCAKSIDIGSYNKCNHGCIYCYANSTKKTLNLLGVK